MAERKDKNKTDNSDVMDMLARLRLSVQKDKEETDTEHSAVPDALAVPETETVEDVLPVADEITGEPAEEITEGEFILFEDEEPLDVLSAEDDMEENEEEPEAAFVSDSDVQGDDIVDDSVISQFFAPVEEMPETESTEEAFVCAEDDKKTDFESTAEGLTEDAEMKVEDVFEEPNAEPESIAEGSDTVPENIIEESGTDTVDAEEEPEDEGREYDVISFEETEEGPHPAYVSLDAEEPEVIDATDENGEDTLAVSDREAELLFRPISAPRKNYIPVEEDPEDEIIESAEEEPVIANEENGYAVEVEVKSTVGAWYSPAISNEEDVEDEPIAAETVEDETVPQELPTQQPQEQIEDFEADDTDDTVIPAFLKTEEEFEPPLPTDDPRETEAEGVSAEEIPSTSTSKKPKKEKPDAGRVAAVFFGGTENRVKKKKNWGVNTSQPEALAGIYNEAGADYHEYTSRNQISLFSERFKAEIASCTLRIAVLSCLCVLLLLLENMQYVGLTLGGIFAAPGGMAATHLILLIFVVLCSVPTFSYAWRHLFGNRILPEIYFAICLVCALLYDVYLLFSSSVTPLLFGLIPAVGVLVASVVELAKVKGDYTAFRLVSSSGDKLAMAVSGGAQTKAEADAVADLEEGRDTRILSVKKVGFTAGFFHRVSRICEDVRKNLWLLITAVAASLMAAVISGVFQHSFDVALYAFCVTVSFSFPACSLILHKLPVAQLFNRASVNNTAVVGEVSAIEYCDAAAAAFEDVEAFPARNVRVQRIKLYGDHALDMVLYQVAGLFSLVGGPLDGVFRSSTAELGLPNQAELTEIADGGIAAMVNGQTIRVGRGDYMLKNRIRMYYDPEDESILASGKVNVMYATCGDRLMAKFYIRYKMDADFEKDVEALSKRGVRTVIRTYDPNISGELIDSISYTGRFGIRVVKKTTEQQKDYAVARLNSGIVTKTTTRDLLRTLFACRRMCRLVSFSETCNMLVASGGMLLSLILAVFGALFGIPSVFFALYQLLWVGVIALAGKLYI